MNSNFKLATAPVQQRGFTLVEAMVSIAISLVAVAGMILVMGNTVGTTSQVIEATRLNGELRASMQVLSRDLRRSNFDHDFISCIGSGGSTCTQAGQDYISVTTSGGEQCIQYQYDRYDTSAGDWTPEYGAVRKRGNNLEFNADIAGCASANSNWDELNDPNQVRITAFVVTQTDGDDLSFTQTVSTLSQTVNKIRVSITGEICNQGSLATCASGNLVSKTVENTIRVRNDVLLTATP